MEKTNQFTIEKGIPFPEKSTKCGEFSHILNEMDVGDSVVFPFGLRQCIQNAATYQKRHHSRLFKARRFSKGEFRIWRIK